MKKHCFGLTRRGEIAYDDWLCGFLPLLQSTKKPVIDLGCGNGNDTLFLVQNGISVIPCDISEEVVSNMHANFPELVRVEQFDMSEGLPFHDGFSDAVIADLSLHFFDNDTTFFILNEIKRVLRPNGILLFRLNSTKDIRQGAGSGTEISPGLFLMEDGRKKRFFDEEMIRFFFKGWELFGLSESVMHRYAKPKTLWTALAKPLLTT